MFIYNRYHRKYSAISYAQKNKHTTSISKSNKFSLCQLTDDLQFQNQNSNRKIKKSWNKKGLRGYNLTQIKKMRSKTICNTSLGESGIRLNSGQKQRQLNKFQKLQAQMINLDKVIKGQLDQKQHLKFAANAYKQLILRKTKIEQKQKAIKSSFKVFQQQNYKQMVDYLRQNDNLSGLLQDIKKIHDHKYERTKNILLSNQLKLQVGSFQKNSKPIVISPKVAPIKNTQFIQQRIDQNQIKNIHQFIIGAQEKKKRFFRSKAQIKKSALQQLIKAANLYQRLKLSYQELSQKVHLPDKIYKRQGSFMLFKSIIQNKIQIVIQLLKVDRLLIFDINQDKKTPLVLASQMGRLQIVRLILSLNPMVDHKDNNQMTALCYATNNNYYAIVQELLLMKADPWSQNRKYPLRLDNEKIKFIIKNARMVYIILSMARPNARKEIWNKLKERIKTGKVFIQQIDQ